MVRLDALESKVLPALDALCPDVPRILVGTETDIKEEHYDHSHPTAISMSFSNFVERHHCHAAVLTSAMSNRYGLRAHLCPPQSFLLLTFAPCLQLGF
jgi:GTPase SAR1 family protein